MKSDLRLWGFSALGALALFFLIYPLIAPAKIIEHKSSCLNNTKQLAIATVLYHEDNAGFPPSGSWVDATYVYIMNPDVLQCPNGDWEGRILYNEHMGLVPFERIEVPERTALFFDGFAEGPSPSGSLKQLELRHKDGVSVTHTNTSAKHYRRPELKRLRWIPDLKQKLKMIR